MSWEMVGQIAIAAIISAGGIGGIIIAVVKFSANQIAEHMNKKLEASLNKELEKYKHIAEKKNYVSKVRFDAEFKIYRELSQVFSEAIEGVHGIIPFGEAYYPNDEEERNEYKQHLFAEFAKASSSAQKTLFANAPFISKNIYEKFNEIMDLIRTQSEIYIEANFDSTLSNDDSEITEDDINRTALIDEKFNALMDEIREYLSNLEILEDK